MPMRSVTASFPSPEHLDAALFELRRSGAVCHTGTLAPPPFAANPTLHVTVRPEDAVLARVIVRRAGGQIRS